MEIARRPAFYRGEFDAAKTIDIDVGDMARARLLWVDSGMLAT
jgi:hypothetical protein